MSNRSWNSRLRAWKNASVGHRFTLLPSISASSNAELPADARSTRRPPAHARRPRRRTTTSDRRPPWPCSRRSPPAGCHGAAEASMKSVNPGANPSSASQCGPNHVPGKTPRPGLPECRRRSARARCRAPCPRGMPHRRCTRVARARASIAARSADQNGVSSRPRPGRPDSHREKNAVDAPSSMAIRSSRTRVLPGLERHHACLDAESPVVIEALVRPHVEHLVTLGGRGRRQDQHGTGGGIRATQDPAIDRLGPWIEFPGPEQA